MNDRKPVNEWMTSLGIDMDGLLKACLLDRKVVEAIIHGRYTPSPQQRQRIAAALGLDAEQIAWGHVNEVQNLYGHGPQFGRTP
jgi:hypothetical protein